MEATDTGTFRAQFAHPQGLRGRLAGRLMAWMNQERSLWVIDLLKIQRHHRVLEVGFGPGVAVQRASQLASEGFVAGVDHSAIMVTQASRRNAAAIRAGRVDLRQAEAWPLPYADGAFDKAFAINVAHFWNARPEPFCELLRVLRPGGRVAIAYQPMGKDASEDTAREAGRSFLAQMLAAGFSRVRLEMKATKPVSTACVLGAKEADPLNY